MELRERISIPYRLATGVSPRGLLRSGIIRLSRRYPRAYLALVVAAAGTGFAFMLLFPYLLFSMPGALFDSVTSAQTPREWLLCAAQASTLVLGGIFTYTLVGLRFTPSPGTVLTERDAPRLFKMLSDLQRAYGKPRIHRVMLDDGPGVRVAKAPRSGLPLFTTSTLVIGLPMLQTVSPYHLRVLLARRIGPLSSRCRDLDTWLHHLNDIWQHYGELRRHACAPARLIGRFFRAYAPLYRSVSLGVARRAELNADRRVLDVINHQEAVEAISYHAACRDFLLNRYWPTIERMAGRMGGRADYLPYQHMTEVAHKGLSVEALDHTLVRLYDADDHLDDTPGFGERLENIGYSGPIPLQGPDKTAAQYFLEGRLPEIVTAFDEDWRKKRSP